LCVFEHDSNHISLITFPIRDEIEAFRLRKGRFAGNYQQKLILIITDKVTVVKQNVGNSGKILHEAAT
jgi:hypothetical protein